jgi:hypothetical protein
MSTLSEEGLAQVIESACEISLKSRVEIKLKSKKVHKILQHLRPIKLQTTSVKSSLFIPRTFKQQLKESNGSLRNIASSDFRVDKLLGLGAPQQRDTVPETLICHNIFDLTNIGIATNLSKIEHEEDQMYGEWFCNNKDQI